jgi:aquaporin Z
MRKYVVEFIGTFFLVLTIGLTVIDPGAGTMAPFAIGLALAVMVYAGGHISGAHYNPAVTLAVFIRGKISRADVAPYMLSQVLGAILAAVLIPYFKLEAAITPARLDISQVVLAELLFTFALAYIVLNVTTAKGTAGNSFYGLAIGMTVTVGAYAVGGISGAAFNPAVTVAIILLGIISKANLGVYLISQFGGAGVAAVLFKMLNPQDN